MAEDVQEILARLKVQNAAAFNAEMKRASGSVDGLTHATERNAEKTKVARLETFAWGTAVKIARAHMILGTFAIEAMIAETIHLGLEFDEAKTKGMAAFTGILGSAGKAKRVMAGVVDVGDSTGLELPGLIKAETRLLDMGFAGKQSLDVLDAISTFSQKRDLGFGGVTGLTNIFARINQQGKLTGRTMLGLIRLGVPVTKILKDQLHLTDAQVKAIQGNKLSVGAPLAIEALTKGLATTPGELGLQAEVGRVRNIVAQLVGGAEEGGFVGLSRFVGNFGDRLQAGLKASQAGKSFLLGFDPSGRIARDWTLLSAAISGVTGALVITFRIGRAIFGLFTGLSSGEGVLTRRSTILKYVVEGLTLAYIGWKVAIWLGVAAKKADAFWTGVSTTATKLYEFWVLRAEYATDLQTAAVRRLKLAMMGLTALAPVALVIGVTYLFTQKDTSWKSDSWNGKQGLLGRLGITQGITSFVSWLGSSEYTVITTLLIHPFEVAERWILGFPAMVKNEILGLVHWLEQNVLTIHISVPGAGVLRHVPFAGDWLTGKRALGGPTKPGGHYLVGENGPEIWSSQTAGKVTPLNGGLQQLVKVLIEAVPITVNIDGKKVGEGVVQWITDGQVG